MHKILGKCAAFGVPYVVLAIAMGLSGQPYGSGPALAVALKSLSWGLGEMWGIFTLIALALLADGCTAYLFRGL